MKNPRGALGFIFVTMLIDVLGFGIIIPVLPKLVANLGGGGSPSQGAFYFGFLLSIYGLMQFLFLPVLGALSDRYGRRPVLLFSLFFSAVEFVIMALAHGLGWLVAGRALTGLTGASMTVASAYIADITPPEKRAQNFGLIGAAFGLGFILGPAAGGLLSAWSERAPFWAAALLTLLNFFYGLWILPESLALEHRKAFQLRSLGPAIGFRILNRYRFVRDLSLAVVALALGQQFLQATWVLYTTYRYHWSELDNGLSLALVGLATGVVQMFVTGKLVARFGERRTVLHGLCFSILGFLGFAISTQGWMMSGWIVVWCLGGVVGPSLTSLMTSCYGADEQGILQGSITSLQSLMGIVGPLVGTWVFSHFTASEASPPIPGAPFFLSTALASLAALLVARAFWINDHRVALQK